jgi:hypothetical protein
MVLLGNDMVSMVLNFGWGVLVLLAAWCIGRPYGVAAVTTAGAAVILCAPGFVATQPGAAHSDVVGLAFVLMAVALLVTSDPRRVSRHPVVLTLAGLALGGAIATKWTFLPVALVLTAIVVTVLLRRRHLLLVAAWVVPLVAVGCFSYVQNWVVEGNPLPLVDVTIGPVGFEATVDEPEGTRPVAAFLFDRAAWDDNFVPGFDVWFGVAWSGVLIAAGAGLVLALVTGPCSLTRLLAATGALALVGYVCAPQLLTFFGRPLFFASNLRYAVTGLTLGLVLLPVSKAGNDGWRPWVPMGLYVALIVTMQLDPAIWPTELRAMRAENPVRGMDAAVGVLLGSATLAGAIAYSWLRRRTARPNRGTRIALVVACVVVLGSGAVLLQDWYLSRRYARVSSPTPFLAEHWRSWKVARDLEHERIGYRNTNLSYPLLGNDLSNQAEVLGDPIGRVMTTGVRSSEPKTCREWRSAVNRGRFSYVVIYGAIVPPGESTHLVPLLRDLAPAARLPPLRRLPEVDWLAADSSTTVVFEAPQEIMLRVDGPLDPATCPSA